MRFAALLALALLFSACPPRCEFNAPCACGDGGTGSMVCNQPRDPGSCNCGEFLGGGPGGGGGALGGGGGGSVGGGTGGATGGGGGAQPSITLQQFCADYPAAACATRIACGRYSDAGMEVCLEREWDFLGPVCERADAGFVSFDGVVAASCLMDLQSGQAGCASDFPPCQLAGLGRGTVRSEVFAERLNGCGAMTCGTDTICDYRCTGAQCVPRLGAGEPCDTSDGINRDCVSGTQCANRDGGIYRCEPLTPRGGDCSDWSCLPTDYCDSTQTVPTCQAKLPREAACDPSRLCADGVCRSDGRCGALDAGARCAAGGDCGDFNSNQVCIGLQVSADGGLLDAGVCGPRPLLGQACSRSWARNFDPCNMQAGEACLDGVCTYLEPFSQPLDAECPLRPWGYTAVPYYGFAACERGLACRPDPTARPPQTGRCKPAQPEGGECRDEFECVQGLSCYSGADGGRQCVRLADLGETCTFSGCKRDLQCLPRLDGGSDCAPLVPVDGGCLVETCVPTAQCVAGVCERLSPAGAPCTYGITCESGFCQLGQCVAQCLR